MIRHTIAVILTMTMLIVMPILIFIMYTVTPPFFDALGREEHAVFGGLSGNSVIAFDSALILFAMGMLAIPTALGLYFFYGRRSQPTYGPYRRP